MNSTYMAAWLATGFTAALLDYSFAAGFGLVASLVLSGILGYDPRSVAGAAALAQVLSALPVLVMHHRLGNISEKTKKSKEILAVFSLSSLLTALVISTIAAMLSQRLVDLAYTALLLGLAALLYNTLPAKKPREDPPRGHSYRVASLYGALAGAYKSLIGGGYSAIVVLVQRRLGLDLRSAIAVTPLVKLPSFTAVALVYAASGHLDPVAATALTLGALAATPLAAHILRKARTAPVTTALIIAILVIALAKIAQILP